MSLSHSQYRQIATRYVDALFALALDQNKQDVVGADLNHLKETIESSADFRRLMHNPMVPTSEMLAALEAIVTIFKGDDLTKQALRVIVENKRVETLPYVADIYASKLAAHKGELSAEVITAKPISEKQKQAIEAALKKAAGQDVKITTKEDPAILGGLIVRMGSRMLDRSVAGKLQRLKATLTSAAA